MHWLGTIVAMDVYPLWMCTCTQILKVQGARIHDVYVLDGKISTYILNPSTRKAKVLTQEVKDSDSKYSLT